MNIELPPQEEAAAIVTAGQYCGSCILRPPAVEPALENCGPRTAAVAERVASPTGTGYNLHVDTGPFCPMRQVPLPGGGVAERGFGEQ